VMPPIAAIPTPIMMALRIFFLILDLGARLMSIVLHFKENFWRAVIAIVERAAMRARRMN